MIALAGLPELQVTSSSASPWARSPPLRRNQMIEPISGRPTVGRLSVGASSPEVAWMRRRRTRL
jgi:hypothetical protein